MVTFASLINHKNYTSRGFNSSGYNPAGLIKGEKKGFGMRLMTPHSQKNNYELGKQEIT